MVLRRGVLAAIVLLGLAALAAWMTFVPDEPDGYVNLGVDRVPGDHPGAMPVDFPEMQDEAPALAQAMQDAYDDGRGLLVKRADIRDAVDYLDRNHPGWASDLVVTWQGQNFRFDTSIA